MQSAVPVRSLRLSGQSISLIQFNFDVLTLLGVFSNLTQTQTKGKYMHKTHRTQERAVLLFLRKERFNTHASRMTAGSVVV